MTPEPDPKLVHAALLQVGDQYWGDVFDHENNHPLYGTSCQWTVVRDPITSINTGLFENGGTCVVVVVEYADGSRGSRLWDMKASVRVRRA